MSEDPGDVVSGTTNATEDPRLHSTFHLEISKNRVSLFSLKIFFPKIKSICREVGSIGLIKGQGHEKHGDDPTPRSLAVRDLVGVALTEVEARESYCWSGRHGRRDP